MSLNYLAESLRARAEWAIPVDDPGIGFDLAAQDQANALSMIGVSCMLTLIVIVLACQPPLLNHVSPGTGTRPAGAPSASFSTARDFLLVAQGVSDRCPHDFGNAARLDHRFHREPCAGSASLPRGTRCKSS